MGNHWMNHKFKKRLFTVFFIGIIILFSLWIRAYAGAMKDYRRAESFANEKQYIKAVTYFDRAMHWYTPFNPYVEQSAEHLWGISLRAEKDGDYILAGIAVESIRNSYYSSRSFYSPGKNWIVKCDERTGYILQNYGSSVFTGGNIVSDTINDEKKAVKYNDPDLFWTIILELGLFGWISSTICFIWFCLRNDKKTDRFFYRAFFWVPVICLNYGIWILGMIAA